MTANGKQPTDFTLDDLREWIVLHLDGGRSFIGKRRSEPTRLEPAYEYHVHRAINPERGQLMVNALVLPCEMLHGTCLHYSPDSVSCTIALKHVADDELRVLHAKVLQAMGLEPKEVSGAPRIVLPGMAR